MRLWDHDYRTDRDIPDEREPEHHIPDAVCEPQTPTQRFYFTFGRAYSLRDNYVVIVAEDRNAARAVMVATYGKRWAFDYDEAGFAGQPEKYGLTEVPLGTYNFQEYEL